MNELALKVREKNLPFLSRILSIHALFGCDTTSRINGFGQDIMVKMKDPTKDQLLWQLMDALVEPNQMPKDVAGCGEKILLKLYGAKTETSSNKMGYLLFKKKNLRKITKSNEKNKQQVVNCKTLPPTDNAATYHCLRVYHQVI